MEAHDPLSTLNSTKISWTLKDNHIIVVARPDVWEKHINVMFEGGLYQITNVYVRDAVGRYRPVTNSNVIHFLPVTVVTLYPDDSIMIPFHKFELTPLGDLLGIYQESNHEHVPEQSTDVIGVLENLDPVRTIQTIDGPTEIEKFTVNDGSDAIKVSYFGPLIDETRRLYAHDLEMPVILILASFKLTGHQGFSLATLIDQGYMLTSTLKTSQSSETGFSIRLVLHVMTMKMHYRYFVSYAYIFPFVYTNRLAEIGV
ncbi:hypothetical protein DCAR_0414555 [Daucus carota subsp. sativus]|uniref:DUF223 domain-containing protein n=1 Tax=Daucus carota subsp. sativus TaxID=79200 RepID=A0A164ZXQ5_DAUCS|nr:hypothetical protein DCAR_0414555 [Daucus carota subsp. sativus]